MNIAAEYLKFCTERGIPFTHHNHVKPYDNTTLFCPAGMQQYKKDFADPTICKKTVANIQPCIRLNDYDEIADGTHLLYFNMIGLFSFRDMSLQEAIDFWMTFIHDCLKLKVDYITIHPDKLADWKVLYSNYKVEIKTDPECVWSDGTSPSAYCTEFYINDIEIGNIVNPGGDCIDVGFGYERLDLLVNGKRIDDRVKILHETIDKIINSGFLPGPTKQGSILRKLIKEYSKVADLTNANEIITKEIERQQKQQERYAVMCKAKKRQGKSREWWINTHGIDPTLYDTP